MIIAMSSWFGAPLEEAIGNLADHMELTGTPHRQAGDHTIERLDILLE